MSDLPDQALSLLVTAMIHQAAIDMHDQYKPGRFADISSWLIETGYPMLEILGAEINRDCWISWVTAGCPTKKNFIRGEKSRVKRKRSHGANHIPRKTAG